MKTIYLTSCLLYKNKLTDEEVTLTTDGKIQTVTNLNIPLVQCFKYSYSDNEILMLYFQKEENITKPYEDDTVFLKPPHSHVLVFSPCLFLLQKKKEDRFVWKGVSKSRLERKFLLPTIKINEKNASQNAKKRK